MKITVVITTWQVPFDQVVKCVTEFGGDAAAKNATTHKASAMTTRVTAAWLNTAVIPMSQ
jgi:hypothetical protein